MASAFWSAWCCGAAGDPATLVIPSQCCATALNWTAATSIAGGADRGRMAERDRQPCTLQLSVTGWQPPLTGDLPACRGVVPLAETGADLDLRSNLPDAVRFSTNGLVLDGGLVVLAHPSHAQALCLVIGLPLGISRTVFTR